MSIDLIYHNDDGKPSPFDSRAIGIAQKSDLRIACPYLSLSYIQRLTDHASNWKLVTDVHEWLASLDHASRSQTVSFIQNDIQRIRDLPGLHAKVLIGNESTLIGSANFTISGMKRKTEMSVFVRDASTLEEITHWFDELWSSAAQVNAQQIDQLIQQLPSRKLASQRQAINIDGVKRDTPLVALEPPLEMRYYKKASGYYVGSNNRFCVTKGSKARSNVVDKYFYSTLRSELIRDGVLTRDTDNADYTFSRDHIFTSPSAAACIVSGQMRNGRDEWGEP